jgi:hypothetical protein
VFFSGSAKLWNFGFLPSRRKPGRQLPVPTGVWPNRQIAVFFMEKSIFAMAKRTSLKQKRRLEKKDARDSKKFFTVVGIITVVLLVLLYVMFQSSF